MNKKEKYYNYVVDSLIDRTHYWIDSDDDDITKIKFHGYILEYKETPPHLFLSSKLKKKKFINIKILFPSL